MIEFPYTVEVRVPVGPSIIEHSFRIESGLTVFLGPNGSGKTQILRAAKNRLRAAFTELNRADVILGKSVVRFISAGRIGPLETYRSDYDGRQRTLQTPDNATFGSAVDLSRRHNYESLSGDILTLATRPDIQVKVQERLKRYFGREISIEWRNGQVALNFLHLDSSMEAYSAGREASGLLHLVSLLSAIYDDEVGAIIIDEPEVSLHPQMQAFLFKAMLEVAGVPERHGNKKLILLSTHSPEFVQLQHPDDLKNIVFCSSVHEQTIQVSADAGELRNGKVRELIPRLGRDHKLALFAHSPLLVEGPSDALICGALASKLDIQIEAGGSQILPVIGKGKFGSVLKLFRTTGKEPLVLADADAFAENSDLAMLFLDSHLGNAAAAKHGYKSGADMLRVMYSDFCRAVSDHSSELSELSNSHCLDIGIEKNRKHIGERLIALRSIAAVPDADLSDELASAFERLKVLLNALKGLGCFFLLRGTIEDYYTSDDDKKHMSKIIGASNQASSIIDKAKDEVEACFGDIVECLRAASSAEPLNEASSLLSILLAVVAPLQAKLKEGSKGTDPNPIAKSMNASAAELFHFSWTEHEITVQLKTSILDIDFQPFTVGINDNVVDICSNHLTRSQT